MDLVEGIPNIHVFGSRAFQLQHYQRQAINKADDIRAAQLLAALDGELVDGAKTVGIKIGKINQERMVMDNLIIKFVFNWHTIEQLTMNTAVADNSIQARRLAHQGDRLLNSGIGQVRVDTPNGRFQISQQQYLAIITALRSDPIRRQIRAMAQLPTTFGEPLQALLFQLIFRHPVLPFRVYSSSSCKELVVI